MPVLLHAHSWYSLLEGLAGPEAMLDRAAACGYTGLALTDTNNLYGVMPFVEGAIARGLRPFVGACLRQGSAECVALVADRAGYHNLCRILSRLHLSQAPEARAHFQAIDPASQEAAPKSLVDLLTESAQGLHLLVDDYGLAEPLREAFGPRLWLELARPRRSATAEQERLAWARRLGLRPIATTAAVMPMPAAHPALAPVTAVRHNVLLDQLPASLPVSAENHLVEMSTLRRRFHDVPEAVANTDALAEQLQLGVLPRTVILPPARTPRTLTETSFLHSLCERGLRRRCLEDNAAARRRLCEELAVIDGAGLNGYFLVVRGIARHARHRGHSMALRGSAGNSLVCYLLEITDVDPLRFNLPMERFLHPGRPDLPDIDLDFDWKVRDETIDFVCQRYGPRYTARISSHLFLQPRSAFREAGKIHGLSNIQVSELLESLADRVDDMVTDPRTPVRAAPRSFPLEPPRWPRILADARRLLGRPRHLSVHPGGVVITPRPIEEYVPLQWAPKGIVITQLDKDGVEYIGLVKIDLLGNRALATVDETLKHLAAGANAPTPVSTPAAAADFIDDSPEAVDRTLDLLIHGDTLGVNQLESPAMRHLLIQMRPRDIHDVIQALALIRPGAASIGMKEAFIRRRRGLEMTPPLPANLEPLLRETEGLMLYEDDALYVVEALTGLSGLQADRFRKRITKHRTDEEARALAKEFLTLCERRGVARAVAAAWWVQLAKFNQYSFCKSHSVSYGLIAWKAAYLKAHHPLAFWTAALNNNQGMYPRRVYIEAIKRAGITVLHPCLNRSSGPFTFETIAENPGPRLARFPRRQPAPIRGALRPGLESIASLSEAARLAVLEDRLRRGPYRDLADLRRRVDLGPETLSLFIRSGALDFTGQPRPTLFLEVDWHARHRETTGDLFPPDPLEDWLPTNYALSQRQHGEYQLLGFLPGPLLLDLFASNLPADRILSRDVSAYRGRSVRVAGLVAAARYTYTDAGKPMQFVSLEDECGLVDLILFPGSCPLMPYLSAGPYVAEGPVEEHYGVLSVSAQRFDLASPQHEFEEVRWHNDQAWSEAG